ncbi:MAG: ATPase P [Thermoleophilia bacterium]|nr:ATPase P [Thermoleophilia bacterium]
MRLVIPGRGTYDIGHLVLDMNGTLGLDGELIEGVAERLGRLGGDPRPVMITADTHGGAARAKDALGLETVIIAKGEEAEQKLQFLRELGPESAIAIGNGANDTFMLKESAVGICVVGPEGASTSALLAADIVVTGICDALDLVLHPQRLVATLRR